jgi:hypothetical protein
MGNDADNKVEGILFKNQGWTNESSLPDAPLLSTAIVSAHRRKERTGPGAEA